MIRINKHPDAPESLSAHSSWNGEDVKQRLQTDQNSKCYICERVLTTDFQVEHHKSRKNYPELAYSWSNLFWSCSYCNTKKATSFDNLLNPVEVNIEDLIKQSFDFPDARAVFCAIPCPTPVDSVALESTMALLDKIFNGYGKSRTLREQRFYDYAKSRITAFQRLVLDWLSSPTNETYNAVVESLDITSEFLGFKYWIIKSNNRLAKDFGDHIIWNKSRAD